MPTTMRPFVPAPIPYPSPSRRAAGSPANCRCSLLAAATIAALAGPALAQLQFAELTPGLPTGILHTRAIARGDVDGDGDVDLVFGNAGQSHLRLNDGLGHFADAAAGSFPIGNHGTQAAVLGDVDADGDLDLVFGNGGQDVLYRNNGTGTFLDVTATNLPVDNDDTRGVALGDIDGDGDLDLVCGGPSQNRLYVNNGSGLFVDATPTGWLAFNWTLTVALGDVDGDNDLDVMFGSAYQDRLWRNDGSLGFIDVTATHLPIDWETTRSLSLGDLDGDGDLDVVQGNSYYGMGGNVRLYRNDGTGHFADVTATSMPGPTPQALGVALADVDGDGDLDLAVGSGGRWLYVNDGAGVFTDTSAARLPADVEWSMNVVFADVDGDEDVDLLCGNDCYPGTSGGSFPPPPPCYGSQSRLYRNLRRQLAASSAPRIGNPWTLDAYARYGPTAIDLAVTFLSTTRHVVPVPPYGTLGIDPMVPLPVLLLPAATGLGSTAWNVPNLPAAVGIALHAQALFFAYPLPDHLSNVVTKVIQP